MALISVIIPIYGVEKYLDKCVESIVNQTYKDLEIILVDDESPDRSPVICDEWSRKDNRVKVIHKKNGGASDARNEGLRCAIGEYIAFVDSDDYLELNFFETLIDTMKSNDADIVECATRYVDEVGSSLFVRENQEGAYDKISALRLFVLEKGFYQTVWGKLYKKSVTEGVFFPEERKVEDEFWTYRVFDKATKIVAVNNPLYNYLQRNTSFMGATYSLCRLDGLDALYERMQYLQKYEQLTSLLRQEFVLSALWHLQKSLRHFKGEEKKQATRKIVKMIKSTPKVKWKDLSLNTKYKIWYKLLRFSPLLCARIRNILKIGL